MKQRIKINNTYSSWSKLTTGVPQGSILGSLLFDTYVCDLFDSNNAFYFANYADDNTPYITGKSTNS